MNINDNEYELDVSEGPKDEDGARSLKIEYEGPEIGELRIGIGLLGICGKSLIELQTPPKVDLPLGSRIMFAPVVFTNLQTVPDQSVPTWILNYQSNLIGFFDDFVIIYVEHYLKKVLQNPYNNE
jgi:hypothetical protein